MRAAIAQAQLQPGDLSVKASARAVVPAQQDVSRARDFSPPAPRGDLRGDIASNVHARPGAGSRESRGGIVETKR